jgi:hypothetical protein
MTRDRSEQPSPDFEISWRTEELGPETRRRLFEQVLPSRRAAAARTAAAPEAREVAHSERPQRTKE